jgi:hypothetical protein
MSDGWIGDQLRALLSWAIAHAEAGYLLIGCAQARSGAEHVGAPLRPPTSTGSATVDAYAGQQHRIVITGLRPAEALVAS